MWNSQEWISFSQAAPGAQRPLLLQSLINLKRGNQLSSTVSIRLNAFLRSTQTSLQGYLSSLPTQTRTQPFIEMCKILDNISGDLQLHLQFVDTETIKAYKNLIENFNQILTNKRWAEGRYNPFSLSDIDTMHGLISTFISNNINETQPVDSINPDTPLPFNLVDLIPHLEQLAQNQGGNILQFVQMLALRMRFLLSDERLHGVVDPETDISLLDWLNEYIGSNNSKNGFITIIDLSLVSSEIINVIIAVISRLSFDAIQRYRRINKLELPTVIVLEEAHIFL